MSDGDDYGLGKRWLSVDEVCAYANKSRTTVYAALQDGALEGSQSGRKGRWTVDIKDVDRWLRSGLRASA